MLNPVFQGVSYRSYHMLVALCTASRWEYCSELLSQMFSLWFWWLQGYCSSPVISVRRLCWSKFEVVLIKLSCWTWSKSLWHWSTKLMPYLGIHIVFSCQPVICIVRMHCSSITCHWILCSNKTHPDCVEWVHCRLTLDFNYSSPTFYEPCHCNFCDSPDAHMLRKYTNLLLSYVYVPIKTSMPMQYPCPQYPHRGLCCFNAPLDWLWPLLI